MKDEVQILRDYLLTVRSMVDSDMILSVGNGTSMANVSPFSQALWNITETTREIIELKVDSLMASAERGHE